ncbi:hypothetical protein BDF22DRAFT_777116 [Syncephalis plumigaleata]|nr:hypothetical protein BDF22DRAFT_777116 [Syncephalis plumigaleata]
MDGKVCKLWVHNERFSTREVIIHPDLLPDLQPGQLLEVRPAHHARRPTSITQAGGETRLFERRVFVVYEPPDPDIMRKQPQLQISLTNHMTTTFGLANWSDVTVVPVETDAATADFILLTFRDQYLGRNDMWRLRLSLLGKTVYISQRVLFAGCIRAQISDIYINGRPQGQEANSLSCVYLHLGGKALIGEGTRVIFRSESAKFFILIQMSKEMWEFDDDGQLFYEKVTHQFLPELFARWKAISANHVVCIVLFTRVFYDFMEPDFTPCPTHDNQQRWYKDYYKVLVDWETNSDWSQVLPVLKREQSEFKRAVLTRETSPYAAAIGTISMARHGNILEAIGLALNTFERHYVDRDLLRTGQAIMVLTPGPGYFEVDKKLLRLTAERMFDSGIALDLVCLDQIPLHASPLFKFTSGKPISDSSNTVKDAPLASSKSTGHKAIATRHQQGSSLVQAMLPSRSNAFTYIEVDPLQYDESNADYASRHTMHGHTGLLSAFSVGNSQTSESSGEKGEIQQSIHANMSYSRQCEDAVDADKAEEGNEPTKESVENATSHTPSTSAVTIDKADQHDRDVFSSIQRVRLVFPSSWYTTRRRGSQALPQNSHPRFRYDSPLSGPSGDDITAEPRRPSSPRAYHRSDDTSDVISAVAATSTAINATTTATINSTTASGNDLSRNNIRTGTTTPMAMGKPRRRISIEDDINTGGGLDVSDDDDGAFPSSSTVQPIQIHSEFTSLQHRLRSSATNIPTNHRHRHASPQTSLSNSPSRLSRSVELNQQLQQQQQQQQQQQTHSSQAYPVAHQHQKHRSSPNRMFSQLVKQTLLNPSRALHGSIRQNDHLRRWEHIYPVVRPLTLDMDWTSLCTPACLPIGTDVFPTTAELAEKYQEHVYTVSPNDELVERTFSINQDMGQFTETLLKELIAQRLSQGFQLIDANLVKQSQHRSSGAFLTASLNDAMKSTLLNTGTQSGHAEGWSSPLLQNAPTSSTSTVQSSNVTNSHIGALSSYWRLPFEFGRKTNEFNRASTIATHVSNSSSNNNNNNNPNNISSNMNSNSNTATSTTSMLNSFSSSAHYLSMGHQIHRLVYDPVNRNVEVKRYVRKLDYSPDPMAYRFAVWPKARDGFESKSVKFNYPQVSLYNWNYLDHLVAGYQEEMTESLKFWHVATNNHTLTNTITSEDNLNEEEMRLNGFTRFLEQFERVRWSSRGQTTSGDKRSRRQPINSLGISLTTFSTISYLENEARARATSIRRASLLTNDLLSKDTKLTAIAAAIKDPVSGVRMQDRWWHLRLFQDSMEFGNQLMDAGLFEHCTHRHRLLDGHYFYRLQAEYAPLPSTSTRGWLQRAMRILPADSGQEPPSQLETNKTSCSVELSRRIMINLDPQQWSDRQETAILHYDVVHNPRNCYHFQLNWLGCTAHLIEDLLQSWSRTAEKCGLRLVEAPVDQERPDADDNPFQSPLKERLPVSVNVPDTFFEVELVKHFGFILDVEADASFPSDVQVIYSYHHNPYRYAQYVHRSGVAFIMVCKEPHSYLWVNNRLYTSHSPHQTQHPSGVSSSTTVPGSSSSSSSLRPSQLNSPDPDKLRHDFVTFCQDKEKLQAFWTSTIETLLVTSEVEALKADGPERIQAPDILDSRDVVMARSKP